MVKMKLAPSESEFFPVTYIDEIICSAFGSLCVHESLMTLSIGGSRGGACRVHATPYGTQFFHFRIHFHRKAPASEVHPLREILDPPLLST